MNTPLWAGTAVFVALSIGAGCTPAAEGDTPDAGPNAPVATLAQATSPRPAAGHAWVIFGADTVVAEVAATGDERADGLMYRQEVPDGTGMLFVFETSELRSFWMQNTYVALDIAFMNASYRIVDILQMEPLTTDSHESRGAAMFALEVRKGWFAEHRIRAGDQAKVVFGVQ